jgi:predicted ester cyclase
MIGPDSLVHDGGHDSRGPEGFYGLYDRITAAFSDIHFEVADVMAEDDKICVRWIFSAKHTGDGLGLPATGAKVAVTGISILRVAGTIFTEGWQNWDMLGMMEQLKGTHAPSNLVAVS